RLEFPERHGEAPIRAELSYTSVVATHPFTRARNGFEPCNCLAAVRVQNTARDLKGTPHWKLWFGRRQIHGLITTDEKVLRSSVESEIIPNCFGNSVQSHPATLITARSPVRVVSLRTFRRDPCPADAVSLFIHDTNRDRRSAGQAQNEIRET